MNSLGQMHVQALEAFVRRYFPGAVFIREYGSEKIEVHYPRDPLFEKAAKAADEAWERFKP